MPNQTADEIRALVDAQAAAYGLTLAAAFVPQSVSRKCNEKRASLNWLCVLSRGDRQKYAFPYTQGIAHAPGWIYGKTGDHLAAEKDAAERGMYRPPGKMLPRQCTSPTMAAVLCSLLLDTDGITEAKNFERWADWRGLDSDSRAAEKSYAACVETANAIALLLNPAERETFSRLLENY